MSAFIVSKEHIDVLVSAGLGNVNDGQAVCPGNAWGNLRWCAVPYGDLRASDVSYEDARRELHHLNADEVGQMLVCENVQSIRARYPDVDEGGVAPGPCDEYWREPYTYTDPRYRPTPGEVLKALACYEYQSCEHDEWPTSEAAQFCEALKDEMVEKLTPREAPWEWDADTLSARRKDAAAMLEP